MGNHRRAGALLVDVLEACASTGEPFVEALAAKVRAARVGDGAEGLAAGQGITLVCDELPPGVLALVVDAVVVVRALDDAAEERFAALLALAVTILAEIQHPLSGAPRLAVTLGAPADVARRHRTAEALARASGLPAWAAALRLRMLLNRD